MSTPLIVPSIYLNLEDDVAKIVARIKREKAAAVVLVCPKRCVLFNDAGNLNKLKMMTDSLGKEVYILTMDERGQAYAKGAGFKLKLMPKGKSPGAISDIQGRQVRPDVKPTHIQPVTSSGRPQVLRKPAAKKLAEEAPRLSSLKQAGLVHRPASVTHTSKPLVVQEAVYPRELDEVYKHRKKSKFYHRFIISLVVLTLISALLLSFVILPKAEVVVYAKTEPITRDVEVSVSPNIQTADASAHVLPGVRFSESLQAKQSFETQGKKEVGNKASGKVRIYNFSLQPLNLKAETTVLSIGDRQYYLVNDINQLKVTKYKNAQTKEIDEKSLAEPVDIIAATGGESFNLPAGTKIEVFNQVFGNKPEFLFAKSETAITGGTTRYLSVVTEQDIARSQTMLGDSLISQLKDRLKKEGLELAQKSYIIEPISFVHNKPVGTESPTFEASLTAKITGLAFNNENMKALIFERITQTLTAGKRLQMGNNGELGYRLKTIDLDNGLLVIVVHFEGKAIHNINLGNVRTELVGKTQSEVNEILKSKGEIEQIDVTIAPSWQKTLPYFAGKIKVSVEER